MWILKNIFPDFLANVLFGDFFVVTVGVILLFVGVFFVGAVIECIKYREGIGETFIVVGFAIVAFAVAIACLF